MSEIKDKIEHRIVGKILSAIMSDDFAGDLNLDYCEQIGKEIELLTWSAGKIKIKFEFDLSEKDCQVFKDLI